MATWTDIPNSSLESGAPARAIDATALRDNPIAITEGTVGAPKIQTAALNDLAVTAAKLATTEQMTTANVGNATKSLAVYAVGSYIFATSLTGLNYAPGAVIAGSSLRPASMTAIDGGDGYTAALYITGSGVAGNWRCMGYSQYNSGAYGTTLWLRYA